MIADTFAGRVHVEWEAGERAAMTPLGQLPFFIEYLKHGGLFDGWVAGCPLSLTSPNAPSKRDILGTVMLSVLAGHRRYAHITSAALRPGQSTRARDEQGGQRGRGASGPEQDRGGSRASLAAGAARLLYAAAVARTLDSRCRHNGKTALWRSGRSGGRLQPEEAGAASHTDHSYMLANLRLVLEVEVQAGNQHAAKHSAPGLWTLLDRLGAQCAPWLRRGDRDWGNEGVISEAERRGQAYLFKLRLTKRVKRALERAMRDDDWRDAGAGWQGKPGEIRLMGWSRQRRVVLLRRRLAGVMITQPQADGQLALGFVEIDKARQEAWEYAVLVPSLEAEVVTIGQLYRDRGDCENSFDELKNHWGWGGFTTHDLVRCRMMARIVALVFNWWNLFVRLADPDHHREAITSRPLLLQAIGRQTNHAGRATVTITSTHGERDRARRALTRIAAFFATLRETAEQLTDLDRWYRILSHALIKYLKGRQLDPPRRLQAA